MALDPTVADHFFLTGGTALSVFYLHHRASEDLYFFSVDEVELSDLSFSVRTEWPYDHVLLRSTPRFLSLLVKGIVDCAR